MKNYCNPGGAPIGPKGGWGEWRARQDRALTKPSRNKAAQKMAQAKTIERSEAQRSI